MNTPHWALVALNEASNSGVLVLSECPLWKDTYSGLLSIFQLGYLVFDIALYELFIYFGYEPLSSHIICIHFHPFIKWFSFCQWFFFAGQKFLRLFRSHLVIYVFFFSFALGDRSRKK